MPKVITFLKDILCRNKTLNITKYAAKNPKIQDNSDAGDEVFFCLPQYIFFHLNSVITKK